MQAMILAAGRGERMRPLTDHTPKPLLEIAGTPLILWLIRRLAATGIRELVINHAHLGEQLLARLGDGAAEGVRITWSPEPVGALETAGGIRQALPLLDTREPFLVVNGDIWCDYDFARALHLANNLVARGKLAHLVLVPNPAHHPGGDFALDCASGLVRDSKANALTFSGIGIYAPALFEDLPPGQAAKLAPLLRTAITHEQVSGECHHGAWVDVGTPARLQELDSAVRQRQCP